VQAGVRITWIALIAVAISLCGTPATPALAAEEHPTGIFAPFAGCPVSDPAVSLCIVARITGGRLVLGRRTAPIGRPLTLQGGLVEDASESRAYTLVPATDGNTLSKTALVVPGGLAGIGGAGGAVEVTATPELVGPVSAVELSLPNLVSEEGVGLRLPIRAKLGNPFLGSSCYDGTAATPLTLNLTDGFTTPPAPNKSIGGFRGEVSNAEQGGELALTLAGSVLVDNAFAVPGVSGCGTASPSIDADLGLPASSGHNTAVLTADVSLATPEAIELGG
jgi:hypothetical protein